MGIQIIQDGILINGKSSGTTTFEVQGTQGQLFSITDDLTGDLFAVSDISGIPIIKVNSSGLVTIDGDLLLSNPLSGTSITETDPIFVAHDAYNVTAVGIGHWDSAYTHISNTSNPHSVDKSDVGLGNVENTALSSWVGTTSITTLGTITTGVWSGTALVAAKVPDHDNLNNVSANEHIDWSLTNALNIHTGNYTNTTYVSSDFTHDNLSGVVANEHIDWSITNALNIHSTNYTNTVYSHPTYNGDDFSVDSGALTGAVIISDIDINVTTDTLGHVTDANGVIATRTLTLANLGYTGDVDANKYVHSSNATTNINTSGAVIVDIITTSSEGHITAMSTRTLTLANLGYTGDVDANKYVHSTNSTTNINTSGAVIVDIITTSSEGHITAMSTRTLTLANLGYTGDPDATNNTGTVESVGLSVPTGFSVGSTPITTTGTIALSFTSGYSLPTNTKQGQWDIAYTHSQSAHDYLSLSGGIVTGNLSIIGDLYISGTTTTINSDDLAIKDNIILLNSGETAAGISKGTAGIEIDRGTASNVLLTFRESGDRWQFTNDGSNYEDIPIPSEYDTGTVTNITTSGAISGGAITTTGTITHLTTAGYKHIPSGGAAEQYLKYNSSGTAVWSDLPAEQTVNNATLTLSTSGVGISGSDTFTANQSTNTTFTVTSNATNLNTASTIVARDASGNFVAGTITAALTGNASTATKWAATKTITLTGDVSGTSPGWDGSGNLAFSGTIVANNSHTHTISNISDSTTVGDNLLKIANDTIVRFIRINANETVSALSASDFRTAIGAGTSSTTGTVTSVSITGTDGIDVDSGSPITGSGTITLGLSNIDETKLDTSVNASLNLADSSLQDKTDVEGVLTGLITTHTHNYTNNVGSVTSVTAASATHLTIATTTTTPVITVVSAPKLTTARTIAGVSFDGTANISLNNNAITNGAGYTTNTGSMSSWIIMEGNGVETATVTNGETFQIEQGNGITSELTSTTGGGIITITNTAPDQTVVLTDGGTTTITGTYPNFTISSADQYVGDITNVSAGGGLSGGGSSGSVTLSLSHLGIQSLTDPNADRIMFWDDNVGAMKWLVPGNNLSISTTNLNATNTTYSDGAGITQTGTVFSIVSHGGTSGSIGTVNSSGNLLGVNLGTTGTVACAGNDSRLSNARTPTAHTLDSHSNVIISSNSTGEILKWSGSAWINNTLSQAGIQASGTYNTIIGTDSDINTSAVNVIDTLVMTDGVITSHSTRTLPTATTSAVGVVRLGTAASYAAKGDHSHTFASITSKPTISYTLNNAVTGTISTALGNAVTIATSLSISNSVSTTYYDIPFLSSKLYRSTITANRLLFKPSTGSLSVPILRSKEESIRILLGPYNTQTNYKRELRIPTASAANSTTYLNGIFKIRSTVATGSVATRGFIEKTFSIATYNNGTNGYVYGQNSYISDIINDIIRIGIFTYDTATDELVLPLYVISGTRPYSFEIEYFGVNANLLEEAHITSETSTTPIAYEYQSTQPTNLFKIGYTTNGSGNFATIDTSNRIRFRTAAEVRSDIGAQTSGTYNTIIGTDSDINTANVDVIDTLVMTDGVITSHSTRTLPTATTSAVGVVRLGTAATYAAKGNHTHHTFDNSGTESGASVFSSINVTNGIVTDIGMRNLTPANIGAQAAGTYNTIIGTDSDINTSAVNVIDTLVMTDGVITSHSTRTLPTATTSAVGVVRLGTAATYAAKGDHAHTGVYQPLASVLTNTTASFTTALSSNITTNNAKISYNSTSSTKVNYITVTQAVNLDTMESNIATNNAKVSNATHTGDVTGSGILSIGEEKVEHGMLNNNIISGHDPLTVGNLVGSDELMVSDNGTIKKMDISVLETYMQSNLSFSSYSDGNGLTQSGTIFSLGTPSSITSTSTNSLTASSHSHLLANDSVTYDKMQNVTNDERLLGRVSGAGGNIEELTATAVRTMLTVAYNANNYSLPTATATVLGGVKIGTDINISSSVISVNATTTNTANKIVKRDGSRNIYANAAYVASLNSTSAISILNGSGVQKINTSGVLTSNAYSDATKVPVYGIYSKGAITTNTDFKIYDSTGDIQAIIDYQENTDVDHGTVVVAQVESAAYTGVWFDYVVSMQSNFRAGTVTAIHDGTDTRWKDVSTSDIDNTSDIVFEVDINSGNLRLLAIAASDNWNIRCMIRGIK